MTTETPRYGPGEELEILDLEQCRHLLGEGSVGCLGLPSEGAPELRPVNFVYHDHGIVIRTGEGQILEAGRCGHAVSFQLFGIDGLEHTGWSVIVNGKLSVLPTNEETLALPLRPWASGVKDRFVKLSIAHMSGLRIPPGRGNR